MSLLLLLSHNMESQITESRWKSEIADETMPSAHFNLLMTQKWVSVFALPVPTSPTKSLGLRIFLLENLKRLEIWTFGSHNIKYVITFPPLTLGIFKKLIIKRRFLKVVRLVYLDSLLWLWCGSYDSYITLAFYFGPVTLMLKNHNSGAHLWRLLCYCVCLRAHFLQ